MIFFLWSFVIFKYFLVVGVGLISIIDGFVEVIVLVIIFVCGYNFKFFFVCLLLISMVLVLFIILEELLGVWIWLMCFICGYFDNSVVFIFILFIFLKDGFKLVSFFNVVLFLMKLFLVNIIKLFVFCIGIIEWLKYLLFWV